MRPDDQANDESPLHAPLRGDKVEQRRFVRIGSLVALFGILGILGLGIALIVSSGSPLSILLLACLVGVITVVAFLRYRVGTRLFPELAHFQSTAERERAWGHAMTVAYCRRGTVLMLAIFGAGAIVLPSLLGTLLGRVPPPLVGGAPGLVCLVGLLFLLTISARLIRRLLRSRLVELGLPICIPCGYDLRGQTVPRCPECGAPADKPESLESQAKSARRRIRPYYLGLAVFLLLVTVIWFSVTQHMSSRRWRQLDQAAELERRASVLQQEGDLAGAISSYRQALEIRRSSERDDRPALGLCYAQYNLGRALTKARHFAEAEPHLLQAEKDYQHARIPPRNWATLYGALLELYDAWHAADPTAGHDRQAAEARAKCDEWSARAGMKPSTTGPASRPD